MAAVAPSRVCRRAHRRDSFLVGREGRHSRAAAVGAGAQRPLRVSSMVDVSDARVVAILTRAPSSGGKSRLFRALACPPDSGLLTALLLDTVDGAAARGVTRVVSVTPA